MYDNDQDLIKKYLKTCMLLHRSLSQSVRFHGPMGNPHHGQGRVLMLLKMKPEITQKELSYLLNMRSQSLGELLAKLEKHGYVTRTQSEEDKRVMIIRLTDEGAGAAEEMCKNAKDTEPVFDCLTDEEKLQLSSILDKITAELMKSFKEGDFGPGGCHEHQVHHHHFVHQGMRGGFGHGGFESEFCCGEKEDK